MKTRSLLGFTFAQCAGFALGKQRLQVEFSGAYEYKTPQGPMANEGDDG